LNRNWISEHELQQILGKCETTTPGPWKAFIEGRDHEAGSNFIMTGTDLNRGNDIELIGASKSDLDFIASAKQDIPILIEEIRRLKKAILQP